MMGGGWTFGPTATRGAQRGLRAKTFTLAA